MFFTWLSADPAAEIPEGGLAPLEHFTPRLSSLSLSLAPLGVGADRQGKPLTAFGLGRAAMLGGDLGLSFGIGALGQGQASGLAGRVSVATVSFGGAWGGPPDPPSRPGPAGFLDRSSDSRGRASYGFDVSYSFGPGSVSLSRSKGGGWFPFGEETDVVALSGRFAFGSSLGMSAWLARGRIGGPEESAEPDAWAVLTGLRLSF